MFDVCVIGGGMVGSAMALGLGQLGFSVAVVEPYMPQPFELSQPPDMRVSAISVTSQTLLDDLGAWSYIKQMRLCPYKRLSVWDKPECRTDFDCATIGHSHLGHIIENRIIQLGLHQAIADLPNVTFFSNTKVVDIESSESSVINLSDGQTIRAKLLVGADGGNSDVRNAVNIGVQGWQYQQKALGIQIKTPFPQQDITWQKFTADGPVAYLPLYDGFAALVWYQSPQHIGYLKGLSKEKLKQQIQQSFPADLVDFDMLEVADFPLTRMHANQYYKGNTVLIGDAAHTINPLAGQGVNLGFKDVSALLSALKEELAVHDRSAVLQASHYSKWLKKYETARRRDNLMMMSAMDLLYSTFSNDNVPLKLLRNLGLTLANKSGPIKNKVMKYAMGFA
ncbi:FAD-dependent monooxygenase [uncultured Paraglaciecola sp.]|uniref:FAD-dependent monooxygenase n=1 Tax=uncultured Paraglaciecola sp. TaxID=1765024 RepID=UPI0025D95442|nr:FAD-dependent monooxygenase [uncultured Paraglaciecola sp.]